MKSKTFIFVLLLSISQFILAQVGIGTDAPTTNSVLQVKSPNQNQGILIPQLGDGEIATMTMDSEEDGMLVFNIDTKCFSYYSVADSEWISLCGKTPPAISIINDCSRLKSNGIFIEGTALSISNYLSIPVRVTRPGTYAIMAITNPDNNYYFSTSDEFPSPGDYVVNVPGAGVPENAGSDPLLITINGVAQSCSYSVAVSGAQPDYRITNVVVNPINPYSIQTPLDANAHLTVTLQVNVPGEWQLTTSTVNGYYFSGNGQISDASGYNPSGTFPQTVTVQVPGYGTPDLYGTGTDNFTLSSIGSVTDSTYPFDVRLATVGFRVDCSNATITGTFTQSQTLTGSETIELPITVISPGNTIITASCAGMIFTSGPISLTSATTSVTLTPTSTSAPNNNGNLSFTLASTEGGMSNTCTVPVTIAANRALFQFGTPTYSNNGNYVVSTLRGNTPVTVTIPVTTSSAGAYSVTATANGVTYAASGSLHAGTGNIVLQPTGTPTNPVGPVNYTITSNSATTTFTVNFVSAKLNILSLGTSNNYALAGTGNANNFVKAALNIGPNGTIKMDGTPNIYQSTATGAALANVINTNNIDIIFLQYNYDSTKLNSQATVNVLNDFVKNRKGALVFASEYNESTTNTLLTTIYGESVAITETGSTYVNPTLNVDDPILNGPFADLRQPDTYFGNDVNNAFYIPSPFPANTTVLATQNGNADRAWLLKHNSLGFVFVGDSGWLAGHPTTYSSSLIYFPLSLNNDMTPKTKNYTGGSVSNSYLLGNILAWAIDYTVANEDVNYQVSAD